MDLASLDSLGSDRPAVFLHGIITNSALWRHVNDGGPLVAATTVAAGLIGAMLCVPLAYR
jgi:hypothetical protein